MKKERKKSNFYVVLILLVLFLFLKYGFRNFIILDLVKFRSQVLLSSLVILIVYFFIFNERKWYNLLINYFLLCVYMYNMLPVFSMVKTTSKCQRKLCLIERREGVSHGVVYSYKAKIISDDYHNYEFSFLYKRKLELSGNYEVILNKGVLDVECVSDIKLLEQ